jgi:hypothetical protein
MKHHRLTTVLGLVLIVLAGTALADNHQAGPGYVDLEWIEIPADATEIQDIDLGPILQSLAADAEEKGDDALVQAIAMIKGVRVKSFSVDEGGDADAAAAVEKIQAQLEKEDWKRLVYMKDGEETIGVHTFYEGQDMVGLMVVMYEPGDSVAFVNVMGDLDLGTMMRLANKIDSDHLEDILEEYGDMEQAHEHDR